MRQIISSFKEDCQPNAKMKIFCPDYSNEELQYLVDFLYDGEVYCNDSEDQEKIFSILNIFGFPKDLKSKCQNELGENVFPGSTLNEKTSEIEVSIPDEGLEDSLDAFDSAVTLEITLDQNFEEIDTQAEEATPMLDEINSSKALGDQKFNCGRLLVSLDQAISRDTSKDEGK